MTDQTVSLRLEGDTSDLRRELDKSAKAMDDLAGTGKSMGADLDRMFAGLDDSGKLVDSTIRGIDKRLGDLTGADRDVVLRANISAAEQGIQQIDRMLQDPRLSDAEIRLAVDKRSEASRAIEDLKDQLSDLGPAARDAGDEMERGLNIGALGGAAASAGIADRLDNATTSAGALRAQLGLTADQAREFDDIAKRVYADNFGDSMGQAAQVTGQVHQALGLVGDDLRQTTEDVFRISDAFEHLGAEPQIIVEDLRAMNDLWPGTSHADLLDMVTESFQRGTGSAGDLGDTLQEYPQFFGNIGLHAEDMFRLFDLGMENNARNTDVVADSFKEMALLVREDGSTAQQAIHDMFPPDEARRLISDFSAGGEAGRDAFYSIIEAVAGAGNEQERFNTIMEVFGSIGSDNANVLDDMLPQLVAMKDETREAGDATETLNAQYDGFRNNLEGLMRQLETSVVGGLGEVGVGFADVGANVGIAVLGFKGLKDVIPGLDRLTGKFSGNLGSLAKNAGALAIIGISVERTINAWSDAMSDASSDAESFVETFTATSVRPVDSLEELHDEILRVGGAAAEMKRRGDEALNPFLKGRFREAEAGLILTRDALLESEAAAAQFQAELGVSADEAARMATNSDVLTAALDTSTGELDSGEAKRQQAAEDYADLEATIRGVNDALHAQFDPLFAAQDALLNNADAQARVTEAEWRLVEAQENVNAAVNEFGRDSPEATRASFDLMGAQDDLDRANRDAARSALDVTTATNELAAKMRDGQVDIDGARNQLRLWVDQGLITEDQARQVSDELAVVAWRSAELEGTNILIPVGMDKSDFDRHYNSLQAQLAHLDSSAITSLIQRDAAMAGRFADGGLVTYRAAGGAIFAPRGTDTVPAMLTPGEYAIRRPVVPEDDADQDQDERDDERDDERELVDA